MNRRAFLKRAVGALVAGPAAVEAVAPDDGFNCVMVNPKMIPMKTEVWHLDWDVIDVVILKDFPEAGPAGK